MINTILNFIHIRASVILICVFGAVLVVGSPLRLFAQAVPSQAHAVGYNDLVFSDEFEVAPSPMRWHNGLWYEAPSSSRNLSVSDGTLRLLSHISLTTLARDLSQGLLFRHGYFEARMRWRQNPDDWAAFWLFSYQHAKGIDNNRWCEIDVFEDFGRYRFVGTVHEWLNFETTHNANNSQWAWFNPEQWNTYGVLWEPGKLTWFLNNRVVMSATTPLVCEEQDLFLIIASQSHSKAEGNPLDVDWVRVYGDSLTTVKSIETGIAAPPLTGNPSSN